MKRLATLWLATALAVSPALAQSPPNSVGLMVPNGGGSGAPTGAAGGDLSGTYPNPGVAKIAGVAPGTGVPAALGNVPNANGGFPLYTSGAWTPTIVANGVPGTPTYAAQVGSYEIVGRQVTARFNLLVSNWAGSPTGNVQIGGLPVASTSTTNDVGSCQIATYTVAGLAASNIGITGLIAISSSNIVLEQAANTGTSQITVAQYGTSSTQVTGVCHYHT